MNFPGELALEFGIVRKPPTQDTVDGGLRRSIDHQNPQVHQVPDETNQIRDIGPAANPAIFLSRNASCEWLSLPRSPIGERGVLVNMSAARRLISPQNLLQDIPYGLPGKRILLPIPTLQPKRIVSPFVDHLFRGEKVTQDIADHVVTTSLDSDEPQHFHHEDKGSIWDGMILVIRLLAQWILKNNWSQQKHLSNLGDDLWREGQTFRKLSGNLNGRTDCPIQVFISDKAWLGSFGLATWNFVMSPN